MAFPPRFAVFPGLFMVLQLAGANNPADKFDDLVNNSPFGLARTRVAADNAAGDPLEFRAVLEEKGGRFFSIYEIASHRSTWVDLNDPVNGFTVKVYDEAHERVTVEYQGKFLMLPLRRAPPVAPATLLVKTPAASLPIASLPANTEDQDRLTRMAEEVRRRRASRLSSPGSSN